MRTLLIVVWGLASVFVGGLLASFHQPFRLPDSSVLNLAGPAPAGRWRAVHFLAAGCGCSQRLARHLIQRGPREQIFEQVVVVGSGLAEADVLERRGFHVTLIGEQELGRYRLRGVPLLLLVAPDGSQKYAGGYGSGGYQDVEIWNQVKRGITPPGLPVIGCAVGTRLRKQVDPFSWKY